MAKKTANPHTGGAGRHMGSQSLHSAVAQWAACKASSQAAGLCDLWQAALYSSNYLNVSVAFQTGLANEQIHSFLGNT